jgi:uncharacterized protein (DUF2252 family)
VIGGDMTDAPPIPPPRPSREERLAHGREARERVPVKSLGEWVERDDRRDPIELLIEQCRPRVPELVPIKFGRMMASPFAYYRGSPIVMANDLAQFPTAGIDVQAGGDAHLLNFGLFATPERNLIFDVNDFDETHIGPWEWDVKRLAASVVVAGRDNGLDEHACRAAAHATAASYAARMHEYAEMDNLDVWYSRVDAEAVDDVVSRAIEPAAAAVIRREMERGLRKAQHRTNLETLPKITELVDGKRRIIDDPPLIHHLPDDDEVVATDVFARYRQSLPVERRTLLDRYTAVDVVRKVVGVGSVGTRCYLLLLLGDAGGVPLFLQIKEAERSVLEPHTVPCEFANQGERVIVGQRLVQAASDLFLGWTQGKRGHHFYVRQLRDMKGSARVDHFDANGLALYGALCAWTLARGHARSSGAARIAGYIGKGNAFSEATSTFALKYAIQNERDHERFLDAIKGGRIFATPGF